MKYYYIKPKLLSDVFHYFARTEDDINFEEIVINYKDGSYPIPTYLNHYDIKYTPEHFKFNFNSCIITDFNDKTFRKIYGVCRKLKSILDNHCIEHDLKLKRGYFIGNIGESSIIFHVNKIIKEDNRLEGFGVSASDNTYCVGDSVQTSNIVFYAEVDKKEWYKFIREFSICCEFLKRLINKYNNQSNDN